MNILEAILFVWQDNGEHIPPPVAASSPVLPKHPSVAVEEEEYSIKIIRQPGQGLGISIAGGLGSTPYRGDDEVRYLPYLILPVLKPTQTARC